MASLKYKSSRTWNSVGSGFYPESKRHLSSITCSAAELTYGMYAWSKSSLQRSGPIRRNVVDFADGAFWGKSLWFHSWGREMRIIHKHYFGEITSGLYYFYLVLVYGCVTVFKHNFIGAKFVWTSASSEFWSEQCLMSLWMSRKAIWGHHGEACIKQGSKDQRVAERR